MVLKSFVRIEMLKGITACLLLHILEDDERIDGLNHLFHSWFPLPLP